MPAIRINGNELDPEEHRVLAAFGLESEDSSKSDYILVQTKNVLTGDQEDELEALGVKIHEYVSKNTYLCGYKEPSLDPIRSLPFVAWANVYLDLFVVDSHLKTTPRRDTFGVLSSVPKTSQLRNVDILFHHDSNPNSEEAQSTLAETARADPDTLTVGEKKIRVALEAQYLEEVASLDFVRAIQEVQEPRLFNSKAVEIMMAEINLSGTDYEGEGQVLAVADTGFDKGSTSDTHAAFTGRVKKLYALGRPSKSDDPNGHGTHVSGSALGDGTSASMGGKIRGTAPKATLVLQSLLDRRGGLGGIPADLRDLFIQPYKDDGAKVHTNSWGSSAWDDSQLPYDTSSEEIDRFVWEHPDMLILYAAGNDGVDKNRDGVIDPKQIGSQAASKNCVTVGASENNRPDVNVTYDSRWPTVPIKGDRMADNPAGMAAFSSRGPTAEGRIKPDVVAPGTAILSTRSRNLVRAPTGHGVSSDPSWYFSAGTSMATPLVAGSVVVLRESLVKNGKKNPTAALLKAMLINGAVELAGQYVPSEAGPSPNNNSGFGRVNLKNSIVVPNDKDAGWHEGKPLNQDESAKPVIVTVPGKCGESGTLKVTLVWSDPPGRELQNDLDLIVIASDGSERHGNMGEGTGFDRANNVEQVLWTKIPAGETKIIIRAYHIVKKELAQPYALAWSINRPVK
ncbi:hypothetical protein FQN57_000655 [Myotisia sp. PD_48]|nr:hypothetical protein FQN57_000655 [Myotisia sp. PD_48]